MFVLPVDRQPELMPQIHTFLLNLFRRRLQARKRRDLAGPVVGRQKCRGDLAIREDGIHEDHGDGASPETVFAGRGQGYRSTLRGGRVGCQELDPCVCVARDVAFLHRLQGQFAMLFGEVVATVLPELGAVVWGGMMELTDWEGRDR